MMPNIITGMMSTQCNSGGASGMLVSMLIIFAIFYFMLIRPQQRREKERQNMLNNIKSGDKVIFAGGIIGIITNVKEHTLTVKIADGVKIEVLKNSVSKVIEKETSEESSTKSS